MKKGLLIILMAALTGAAFGQRIIVDSVRVDFSKITGPDTLIAFPEKHVMSDFSIYWDFTTLDTTDAVWKLMVSDKKGSWKPVNHKKWPYKLDNITQLDTSTNTATDGIYGSTLLFPFVAAYVQKNSVDTGYLDIKRVFLMPLDRQIIKY